MAAMIAFPWIAALVAAGFAALWWSGRKRVAATAAGAWALYSVYEYLMYTRVLCSGECNIRVDLLLLYPVLLLLSGAAIVWGRR